MARGGRCSFTTSLLAAPSPELLAGPDVPTRLEEAFLAVWHGIAENDAFNGLILSAGLDWRDVAVLRACGAISAPGRHPVLECYMAQTLVKHSAIARELVALFEIRFDPKAALPSRSARRAATRWWPRSRAVCERCRASMRTASSGATCESDRRRSCAPIISSRRRGRRRTATSCRSRSTAKLGRGLPEPGPSPRSSSIRPMSRACICASADCPRRHPLVGPAGGFPHRGPGPRQGAERQECGDRAGRRQGRLRAEAAASRRQPRRDPGGRASAPTSCFVSSLLDITDNLKGETVVPPADVVRRDGDDPYLGGGRRQGHGDLLRYRQRHCRRSTASGSTMPSPPAARPATTTRRWPSPRAAPGRR